MTTDEAKDEMMAMMRARRFQTFQSSINAISSQPPDFDEVVQLFGLTIEVGDDGVPVVPHCGVKLLPHQTTGIGFIAGMLLTNLWTALLADETGLGLDRALPANGCVRAVWVHLRLAD